MSDQKTMGQVTRIDKARILDHLGEMVREAVEERPKTIRNARSDLLCGPARYERTNARTIAAEVFSSAPISRNLLAT